MAKVEAQINVKVEIQAQMDVRYSFTAQYLCASALFARRCADIERENPEDADEPTRIEHRGLVTAAIMQCTAAVEAESAELTMHGPGSHLGSNPMNQEARELLAPLADFIDGQDALSRYKIILHILRKPPMAKGEHPWQDAAVLVRLRNELIHYKSKWGEQMKEEKLYESLQNLRLSKPPFVHTNTSFFPHQFLGAACAAWSVRTAVAFINGFYDRVGTESRLKPFEHQFTGF